jgi:hypothetical protein
MICALLLDADDSPDFPGNGAEVLGRPLCAYPLIAARHAREIGRTFVLTDSPTVRRVALQYGAHLLTPLRREPGAPPPSEAAMLAAAYPQIVDDLTAEKTELELLVVLHANTGAVHARHIDEGISALLDDETLDSAVTMSRYDRWAPNRAYRDGEGGQVLPAARAADMGTPWFPDWGAQVLRPRLVAAVTPVSPELSWLGAKVKALKQAGGGPVDYAWQVPKMEYWLKKQGFTETQRPEPKPKLQPAPKGDRR